MAIQAVPNVTDAFIAPVLGPFGGYEATDVKYRKHARQWRYPAYGQGYDPLRGTYWDNVAPYSCAYEPDPLRGTYWDNVAPY